RVSKKDIVRQTQSLLTRAGFDPGPADGLFGLKTQEAILAFQKKHGLSTDGEISPALLKALSQIKT
ncbi:MAG: peptidoglycan-binding protein, partial [Nitratireductor sp.]